MKHARSCLGPIVFSALLAATVTARSETDAQNSACRTILKACRQAGFEPGHGLKRACFDPIVQGSAQPRGYEQSLPQVDPESVSDCRSGRGSEAAAKVAPTPADVTALHGRASLTSEGDVVYDPGNKVYWLADANLAASSPMNVDGINPNGMMDYLTAVKWVRALNDHKWLGHNNWQLPHTPFKDPSCGWKGHGGASFGGLCQGDDLGNLYYVGLGQMLPDNVAPHFGGAKIGPFEHMQIAYYWTAASGGIAGKKVFSFASGDADATTTLDSYYYVLPMVPKDAGPIGGKKYRPTCPAGSDLTVYDHGPAANQAVFQCSTGISWPVDANLAATEPFGLKGDVPKGIRENRPYPSPGNPTWIKPVKYIEGGAMLWKTAGDWVDQLKASNYLQSNAWKLPDSPSELSALFTSLNLQAGDHRLMATGSAGPFKNLQPFFYWEECAPDPNGTGKTSADCKKGNAPPGQKGNQMNFDFTFGYGIESTDLASLKYFATAYYTAPVPPFHCSTPITCCIAAGGQWNNGHCE